MLLRRTLKYRLYPSKAQQNDLDIQLGLCRRLYNGLLGVKIETYENSGISLSKFDLNKCMAHFESHNPDFRLIHSQVKQDISNRIDKAFKNMFARIKRGEKKAGFPRFKGEGRYKSICYPQSGYGIIGKKKLRVSKIGSMNIKLHRPIKGEMKTLTITKTATNKYYASFSCLLDETQIERKPKKKSIGIDVGLKSFLTTSEGKHIISPKFYQKAENKLGILQRKHSRKKLRGKNREKSRIKVALCHEKILYQRLDFTHKLSRYFVNNYSLIGIEDLNIKGMSKNHNLSKSILDAGWSLFYTQLQYKAEYADSEVSRVNRFYPSSKTCSKCGLIQDMPLNKRTYKCSCGNILDRDLNAAINIESEILRLTDISQELRDFKPVRDNASTFEQPCSKSSVVDETGSRPF